MAKYVTEFIGTFFLVLVFSIAMTQDIAMAALVVGAMLMVMVQMGAHISGGHYNPAISLAAMMRGALSAVDLLPYWLAQILAAFAAAYTANLLTGASFAPAPGDGFDALGLEAWIVELLFTFALTLVFLNATTSSGTQGNSFYGLAIGFTFFVAIFVGTPISGGVFNPAIGIGPNILNGLDANSLVLHVAGPLIGAALAALIFRMQEAYVDNQLISR